MPCPNCDSRDLLVCAKDVRAHGQGINLIPGMGVFRPGNFRVIVCAACGLTRLFTTTGTLARIAESPKWRRARVAAR